MFLIMQVTELSQFLIKHCYEVFGENIQSLLGDPDEENSGKETSQIIFICGFTEINLSWSLTS